MSVDLYSDKTESADHLGEIAVILCSKCHQVTARIVTRAELKKLSKREYSGPLVAAASGALALATTAAKTGGSAIPSAMAHAAKATAKAATKDPRTLLITAGVAAAGAAVTAGVNYWFSRRKADDSTYAYCANCGHYEAMK